jgi:hypothetical protein
MKTRKPDDFAKRLERYMQTNAYVRAGGFAWRDRNAIQEAIAQFAHRERQRIRREQAPALAHFRFRADHECCIDAVAMLDAATKARR